MRVSLGALLLAGLATAAGLAVPAAAARHAGTAAAATAAPSCGPVWTTAQTDTSEAQLLSVTRTPGGSLWAAGVTTTQGGGSAVIERMASGSWATVPAHAPADTTLSSVAAVSDRDVWAVGTTATTVTGPPANDTPFIDHWNGTRWARVASPAVTNGVLNGVAAFGPGDVWAVGQQGPSRTSRTLIEHWNGTSWSVVPSPDGNLPADSLDAISGSSASSIWAVGDFDGRTLAVYWDGTDWREVTMPPLTASLDAVAAISPSDAWAVGEGSPSLGTNETFAEHWNGSSWRQVPTPSLSTAEGQSLLGVAADGPDDVWAVGDEFGLSYGQFVVETVAMNWNGTAWRTTTVPAISRDNASAVIPMAGGGALAVGQNNAPGATWQVCPAPVTTRGFQPAALTDQDWQTITWRATGNRSALTLRDGSGLKLFRSGRLAAGTTYSFRYYASGSYPVLASPGSARQVVGVPVAVRPASGTASTAFELTWASRVAPFGWVYDIRMKAPGASQFTAFRTGVSSIATSFTPAAGAGTYQFEARLRNTAGGAHSGWSPPVSVTVTG